MGNLKYAQMVFTNELGKGKIDACIGVKIGLETEIWFY